MTQWLFALLLMPVHGVMAWGYWWWLRSRGAVRTWQMLAIGVALVSGLLVGGFVFQSEPATPSPIWPHVAAATASFLTFGCSLLILLWMEMAARRKR